MSLALRFGDAATALVGTPFRLNGRDRYTGLDCIGVAVCALEDIGIRTFVPTGYRLRQFSIATIQAALPDEFSQVGDSEHAIGDLLLMQPGPMQHHLGIAVPGGGFVHAHCGLRKVALQPGPPPWPLLDSWRLRIA